MSSVDSVLPEPYKTDPDENGIFTYVYFKFNSLGEMVKVTQKKKLIKETRKVSKAVYERRKKLESNKFGNAKNSCNTNVTTEEKQDIFIIKPDEFDKEDSKQATLRKPDEILPMILGKTEKQIEKIWDTLTTKIDNPTGRVNADCILMRVF